MTTELISRIEGYLDAAPRSQADAEDVGPFTLFRSRFAHQFFARTSLGWAPGYATAVDVNALCARQRELGLPERLEWLSEIAPYLATACRDAGLSVTPHPLLVHHDALAVPVPEGIRVRRIDRADDLVVPAAQVVARLAFASPHAAVADVGTTEREAAIEAWPPAASDNLRQRIRDGDSVLVVAEDEHGVLCSGGHNPLGDVTEIVGVGTLPANRHQGLGAAVTDTLVADAIRRGIEVIFLSADNEDVARVYERVGFKRIGTVCTAAAT
ncbi:MAG: GNAT family N-acetyltransferase [Actinomycetes bacterium]